jgi:hypothetical protein
MPRHHARFASTGAALLSLAAVLLLSGRAPAQPQLPGNSLPNPQLSTLVPAGGKAGTVVEVTFAGTDVEEPQALVFSHPSIKAEPIKPPPPPPPDPKKPPEKPAPPTPITKFKVTIAADAPPGIHDARLVNKWGVSNARAFVVGDLPEVVEKEPNDDVDKAQRLEMNSTVHGAIASPTDVDYYVFAAKKGQRVVISCLASSIDSRLCPGLEVYDAQSKPLGSNRRYSGTDALVDLAVPEDGDYYVRLFEFTHQQGTAEHFYRLTVSTAPWIDAVFPPMVEPGKATQVTVYGRNLPGGQPDPTAVVDGRPLEKLTATITPPADAAAAHRLTYSGHVPPTLAALNGFEYRVRNTVGTSNPFLISFARAPVVLETEPNDTPDKAQKIAVPCEVAGRIDRRHDRDWYGFTAKKGDVFNIDLLSDRLGAPTDMKFVLRNVAAKADIIEVDDPPPIPPDAAGLKFFARSDDPATYKFVVPADGEYQLMVTSQTANVVYGPRCFYRLRIAPEKPEFSLVVMAPDHVRPDSGNLLQAGNEGFTVIAFREDGFNGDIALSVEGLPKGVTCVPQSIGAGQRAGALVFSAAADAAPWVGEVKVKGTAVIRGQTMVREARPAAITWPVQPQQNIPTVSRLERSLMLAVRDKAPFALTATVDKTTLVQGDKATLTVKLARLWPDFKQPLTATLMDPVPNLVVNNNQPITLNPGKDDATFPVQANPATLPGTYTLVLRASVAQLPFNKDPAAKQKQPLPQVVQPSTPFTITVLPKTVATVTAAPSNPNPKVGTQAEVVVKVARQFDYDGPFKVQLVIPPALKGLAADEVTIPAGKDEAKLVLKVAADAVPGPYNDLLVRTTGTINGNVAVVQESPKFNVNVVK